MGLIDPLILDQSVSRWDQATFCGRLAPSIYLTQLLLMWTICIA